MFLLRRQPKQPPRQLNVWRTPTSSSAAGIRVDKKNLNVEHVGEDDSEFAVISQHPFSLMKDSYFEVTIESLSKNGCVAVGASADNFPLKGYFPGWRKGSYGYHSDDGNKYCGYDAKDGLGFADGFGVGDTIGCGIYKGFLYFTKNGAFIDVAFTCNLGDDKMYPILALDHRTTVSTNFGQEEYKYKISNIDYEAAFQRMGINSLPVEILAEIFAFAVDYSNDTFALALVSHQWKTAIFDSLSNSLWEKLSKLEWPYLSLQNVKMRNWYKFFKTRRKIQWQLKHEKEPEGKRPNFTVIENCGLPRKLQGEGGTPIDFEDVQWERECPVLLKNLPQAARDSSASTFDCTTCGEKVYRVWTQEEMVAHTSQRHCVIFEGPERVRPGSARDLQLQAERKRAEERRQWRGKRYIPPKPSLEQLEREVKDRMGRRIEILEDN